MRVRYIPRAREDIQKIYDWIAKDSPLSARKVENIIHVTGKLLARQPELGVATNSRSVRRLPISKLGYAIFYRIDWEENYVTVLRIVHGKQVQDLRRIPERS